MGEVTGTQRGKRSLSTATSGIVTRDREALHRFSEDDGGRGWEQVVDAGSMVVALRSGLNTTTATDRSGSVAVVSMPPLVEEEGKAERTLRRCLETGDPIENRWDQCSTAFWSEMSGKLLLYRDWRGSPPFYYHVDGSTLRWSTSIRELLSAGVPRVPDRVALAQFQQVGYVPAPRTMVDGIKKVPAGHILSFDGERAMTRRHWTPPFTPKHRDSTEVRAPRVKEILTEAIESMAARSGPTAVMLSGGIDSVVVLAIASKVLGLDLVAFTFNYEDYSGRYNEGPAARVAASALGVEHTDIAIGPAFVMENLPRLIEAYEEPTTYGLHSAHMEPIADVGIDVALSGADAPFLNMPGPLAWALRIGALVPKPMLVAAGRLTTGIQMGIARRANTLLTMASAGMAHQYLEFPLHKVVPRPLARTLYQDPDLEELSSRELEDHLSEEMATEGLSSRDKLVLAGLSGSASEHVLTWNHRWGQLAGISVRFPLCDHDFVAYMSRRTMGTPGKEDLRMLAVEFLPDEVVAAPKIPQTIPLDLWFRGPMKDYMREQLDRELIAEEGTFVPEVIEECLDEHIAGRANHKWAVWSTLTYLVWRKHVLDV